MDEKKITLSIYGGCITRDSFGFQPDDGGYKIECYTKDIHPISAVTAPVALRKVDPDLPEFAPIFESMPNFQKRCLALDINCGAFEYYEPYHSDYLLLDASPSRFELLKYEDGKNEPAYLTLRPKYKKLMEEVGGILPEGVQEIMSCDIPDEEFDALMERFISHFLAKYPEDRIIVNIGYAVDFFIDGGMINIYTDREIPQQRKNFKRVYDFFKRRIPDAHYVEFPEGLVCNPHHKWGRYFYHFVDEYYDYVFEAMNIIMRSSLSLAEERERLNALKRGYEDILRKKYEPVMAKTIEYYKGRESLAERMVKYEGYMKDLLVDEHKEENILRFFIKNRFNRCAFYGASAICSMFIPVLASWGIQVDYVVENMKEREHLGVPVISRDEKSFPDTQVMIISDVMSIGRIREKLEKLKVPFPVADVYEIIQH